VIPDIFCWSKVGSESGESIDRIIMRKEVERIANNGIFTWGVGSSLGDSAEMLKHATEDATVIFTSMLSKPKLIDERPKTLLLWTGGRTRDGESIELPYYSLLTSRGHTETRSNKVKHYALMCRSSNSITHQRKGHLYGGSLVNLKTGNPVGNSQVTAIVKRNDAIAKHKRRYNIEFVAKLDNPLQVILDKYVEITAHDIRRSIEAAEANDIDGWKSEIRAMKENTRGFATARRADNVLDHTEAISHA